MKGIINKLKDKKIIALVGALILVVIIVLSYSLYIRSSNIKLSSSDKATLHYKMKANEKASKKIELTPTDNQNMKLVIKNPKKKISDYIFYTVTDSNQLLLDKGIMYPDNDTKLKVDLPKDTAKQISLNLTYLGSKNTTLDLEFQLSIEENVVEPTSTLIDGSSLNQKMYELANPGKVSNKYLREDDENIYALKIADSIEDKYKTSNNIVSIEKSSNPIYMWYENHTIYFYCAQKIALNKDSSDAFQDLGALKNINDLKYFDTSQLRDMSGMFGYDESLSDIRSLAYFDTSNVESMAYLFNTCTSLTDISPLYAFNTSNVTSINSIFSYAPIKNIDPVKYFDTVKITDMNTAFSGTKITSLDALKDWKTSSLEDLLYTFSNTFITNLNGIKAWDVSKVKTLAGTFNDCFKLTDISGIQDWKVNSVEDMDGTFSGTKITDLDSLRDWKTDNLQSMERIFSQIRSLKNINGIKNWNISKVQSLKEVFMDTSFTDTTPLENWNTSSVTSMEATFAYTKIKNVDGIKKWDVSKVKKFTSCFYYSSLENVKGLKDWNTSSAEDVEEMFMLTEKLRDARDINHWDISKINNFKVMFNESKAKLPDWNGHWDSEGTFVK